jgi:hypothetical protein
MWRIRNRHIGVAVEEEEAQVGGVLRMGLVDDHMGLPPRQER